MLGPSFLKLQLDEKDLLKHSMIESISFNLTTYLQTGEMKRDTSKILAYFDPGTEDTMIFPISDTEIAG